MFQASCCFAELWHDTMPHEAELQARTMAELPGFVRLPNESIDASLARLEVLRHRAIARGGFTMGAQSLSYLLLNGLRLKPEQWERWPACRE